jgi:hypothetical protein
VGQFVDALKTVIINALACRVLLDNVPSIAHGKEAQQEVCMAMCNGDMKVLLVAYISGFIAMRLFRDGTCDVCKVCLTSEVPLPTDAYISFKECRSTVESLTYPTEKLVEIVGTAVTVLESMMLEVAHLDTVKTHITDAIKKSVNFEWIRLTGCSVQYQRIVDEIVRVSQEFQFVGGASGRRNHWVKQLGRRP